LSHAPNCLIVVGISIKILPSKTSSGLVPGVVKLLIVIKNAAISVKKFGLLKHSRYGRYRRDCQVAYISRGVESGKVR
jgi:hypothetical protein